jgi:hypothetical protein
MQPDSSRYSALLLARHALSKVPWPRAWRSAEPKSSFDTMIIVAKPAAGSPRY